MKTGVGSIPSRIMLVGEAWGQDEERAGEPFVGASGQELNRMLDEAGLMRTDCYVTNLINQRPPNNDLTKWIANSKKAVTPAHVPLLDKMVLPNVKEGYQSLMSEISYVQPNVIVAFGNYAMWALTELWGITKWRGSLLESADFVPGRPKIIPTIHPAGVLRQWSNRAAVVNDLKRVKKQQYDKELHKPDWKFIIRPSFAAVMETLYDLLQRLNSGEELWLDFDIETRSGHIACAGISWSLTEALIIPFMCQESREGYWSEYEEAEIVWHYQKLLCHKNVRIRWQNGLYDAQYTHRHWHFIPGEKSKANQDTMISQHSIFSDLPKSLAFQASMYADYYKYWKDEGKTWRTGMGEDQLWAYNGLDCVYTREVGETELKTVETLGLQSVHQFQQEMFWPVLQTMIRGVRVDHARRNELIKQVEEARDQRQSILTEILGHPLNPNSPQAMAKLFYHDLGQPVIMSRAKKGVPAHVTCDDEALQKISSREPLLRPIINGIADIRTLGVFLSHFLLKRLDYDGRMRCSYNIGGSESGKSAPKTYRLSSSENAFGSGTNLQNIPSEKSKSVGKALQRGHIGILGDPLSLPNIRSMFIPDSGFTFFDKDLDRADLHVFAWEIGDELLKSALRLKVDIHLLNVYALDGRDPPPLEELVESHPRYMEHRGPRKHKREFAKVFCHATDYLGGARTVAAHTGRTVHETERAQKTYLGQHPNIEKYWKELEAQIKKRRYVENRFGYRWYIFDRVESVLAEAVAWVPQSTVSIVINKIWMNIYKNLPEAQVLLQVHDSLAGQFPTHLSEFAIRRLNEEDKVVVPYDDPLIIPTGMGTSEVSWGDC